MTPILCDAFGRLPATGTHPGGYCPGCPSCGVDPAFDVRVAERALTLVEEAS